MKRKTKKRNFIINCFLLILICCTIKVNAVTLTTNSSISSGTGYYLVTNKGEFRVYNEGNPYDDTQFTAYKIVDVFYNSSQDAIKYAFTSHFQRFLDNYSEVRGVTIDSFMAMNKGGATNSSNYYNVTSDNVITGGHLTSNEFANLMSLYATYIRRNSYSGNNFTSGSSLSGSPYFPYKSVSLEAGTYLILPRSADYVYAVMVDSIVPKKSGSTWHIDNGNVVAKKSEASIYHTFIQGSENSNAISVNCGKSLQGKLNVAIPTYPANTTSEKRVEIIINNVGSDFATDYQISGMNITNEKYISSSGINVGNTSVGTIDKSGSTLTLSFPDVSKIPTSFKITYKASPLNVSSAVLGGSGNKRQASMILRDPYSSSSPANATITATATLYTYALQITGTTGAVFSVKNNGSSVGNITIGSNGLGELKGLQTGTYTIEQTQAPTGYSKLTGTSTIKVGSGGTEVSGKNGYYNITLRNTTPAMLPFTGGSGTIVLTIFGLLFIIASISFIVYYKKRIQNKQEA